MYEAIVIGGSAGSFQVISNIFSSYSGNLKLPIFITMHRLKQVRTGFVEALSLKSRITIREPDDKDKIEPGITYLAPANYHMLIASDHTIFLSAEEPVNHSRPSIDLLFESCAEVYKEKLVGIILSGANKDGANGLKIISELGGTTIVQDPDEAQVRTMPEAALDLIKADHIFNTAQIIKFFINL